MPIAFVQTGRMMYPGFQKASLFNVRIYVLFWQENNVSLALLTFFHRNIYLESENWQMMRFGLFKEIQARPTSPRAFPRPSMTAT